MWPGFGTGNQGPSSSQALLMPTSISSATSGPSVYTLDGILFTGGVSGLVAGNTTITPGGLPATLSDYSSSLSITGSTIDIDGTLSPLPNVASTTGLASGSTLPRSAPSVTASTGLVYTLDGVVFTGNPNLGLSVAGSTIAPGGPPVAVSSHTFSLPASASRGAIIVDGTATYLESSTASNGASQGSSGSDVLASVTTSASTIPGTGIQEPPVTGLSGSDSATSTDTVEPSDASTEATTNTAWSENLWLTTQVAGLTTVVPVIVGCPGCGGTGGGIILWNFPPIPQVSFQFLKLNIPSVSFPCIPIPLIKSCSSPPTSKPKKTSFR